MYQISCGAYFIGVIIPSKKLATVYGKPFTEGKFDKFDESELICQSLTNLILKISIFTEPL